MRRNRTVRRQRYYLPSVGSARAALARMMWGTPARFQVPCLGTAICMCLLCSDRRAAEARRAAPPDARAS